MKEKLQDLSRLLDRIIYEMYEKKETSILNTPNDNNTITENKSSRRFTGPPEEDSKIS